MGQVEDPSYGIRGRAAEERSAAGAPSSAHATIKKGYELQVTFLCRPGGRRCHIIKGRPSGTVESKRMMVPWAGGSRHFLGFSPDHPIENLRR